MLDFSQMTERIVNRPSIQEMTRNSYEQATSHKRKNAFLEAVSTTMSLDGKPISSLAALTISRMQNTSFDAKWNTFVYSSWLEDRKSFDQMGFSSEDLKKSEESIASSQSLTIMFNIVQSNINKLRTDGEVKVPTIYDVRVMLRKLLVREYLEVLVDGQPLTYKAIAIMMSQRLGEAVTIQDVNYAVRLLQKERKAERRFISDKEFDKVKTGVRELRETGSPSIRQISNTLKQPPNRVKHAIRSLVKDQIIARKSMGEKIDRNSEVLLAKIFLEYRRRFPGKPINLGSVARELDLTVRRVHSFYHRYASSNEVPPVFLGSWARAEKINYKSLIDERLEDA